MLASCKSPGLALFISLRLLFSLFIILMLVTQDPSQRSTACDLLSHEFIVKLR
jgi:hypothetical protein